MTVSDFSSYKWCDTSGDWHDGYPDSDCKYTKIQGSDPKGKWTDCTPKGDGYVDGTAGNDLIDTAYTGDPQGDKIDNNDALLNGAALQDDHVRAGTGNDTVLSGLGNDKIYGGDGNDSLSGQDGNDTIYGENGNDTLVGGAGNNALDGGNGDDRFVGGAGADTFTGGTGQDNLDYSASTSGVTVNLTSGALSGGDAANDHIGSGIDGVVGSNSADSLTGFDMQGTGASDTFTNQFWGNGGNDTISGAAGNDQIYGGNDHDQIHGGAGDDTLAGDAGSDTVDGGTDDDSISGGIGTDALLGGDGNDTVLGDAGDDQITGGAGADSLSGGDDRDTFQGGTIGDVVDGDEGGNDYDTLDLTGTGPFKITYDPPFDENDPEKSENGTVTFLDPTTGAEIGSMSFKNIENVIPCFTPGTLIATPRGEVPVETLRAGDRIITRDSGMQEIRWVGRRDLSWADLSAAPHLKPILIRQGSLGDGLPERDMMVSPNHRVLVANDRTALYFDEHEVLVSAKHLAGGKGVHSVDAAGASYIHFMFDRHEVVLSNGAWTESFQPGDLTLKGMGNSQRSEIYDLFPDLKTEAGVESYRSARRTLKRHEAMLITK